MTRGQKRKQEEEVFVGEGSDGSEEGEVRKKGKGMVEEGNKDKGQKKGGKADAEMEQEEDICKDVRNT